MSDEYEEKLGIKRAIADDVRRARIETVRRLGEGGLGTRETARAAGLAPNTVTRYRREVGLSPLPPVKHVGGGRWVSATSGPRKGSTSSTRRRK